MIQGFRRELQKKTLPELLDCGKPLGRLAKRGTADGKTDVFKIVGCQWSRLEPCEAIEAYLRGSRRGGTRSVREAALG